MQKGDGDVLKETRDPTSDDFGERQLESKTGTSSDLSKQLRQRFSWNTFHVLCSVRLVGKRWFRKGARLYRLMSARPIEHKSRASVELMPKPVRVVAMLRHRPGRRGP